MPKRRPTNAELLILLPWWVSAALALVTYIALAQILPNVESEDILFQALQGAGAKIAPFLALGILFFSGISAFRSRMNRKLLDKQTGLKSLCAIPWKSFEDLVGEVYRRQGYAVEESLGGGADGGIDLVLRKNGEKILVQCKRWKNKAVGAPVVRELYGLMTAENADAAKLITTSTFTLEAVAFATGKPIEMIGGHDLLELVRTVQVGNKGAVDAPLEKDDEAADLAPATPACPKCGEAMVLRTARRGQNEGQHFWGCSSYPKCRGTMSAATDSTPNV